LARRASGAVTTSRDEDAVHVTITFGDGSEGKGPPAPGFIQSA
jgi:hypothetical protein